MIFSGKRLKAAREFSFKTIGGLVKVLESNYNLKVNPSMISRWENSKAIPREENIFALASCLGVSVDYLIGKASFGNALFYLRLINQLTVEELSQKSNIDEKTINFVEKDIGYLTESELKRIGLALNNIDVRSYVKNEEGVNEPITKEEHDFLFSKTDFQNRINLKYVLSDFDSELYYGDRSLSTNERIKLKKIIKVFLND